MIRLIIGSIMALSLVACGGGSQQAYDKDGKPIPTDNSTQNMLLGGIMGYFMGKSMSGGGGGSTVHRSTTIIHEAPKNVQPQPAAVPTPAQPATPPQHAAPAQQSQTPAAPATRPRFAQPGKSVGTTPSAAPRPSQPSRQSFSSPSRSVSRR